MFGKLDGRVGIFPADYVEPMSRSEARKHGRQVGRQQIRSIFSLFFFSVFT